MDNFIRYCLHRWEVETKDYFMNNFIRYRITWMSIALGCLYIKERQNVIYNFFGLKGL
jgi:hypothetical protein